MKILTFNHKNLMLLAVLSLAFLSQPIQAQSKKELAKKVAELESKVLELNKANEVLANNKIQLEGVLKENEQTIQSLHGRVNALTAELQRTLAKIPVENPVVKPMPVPEPAQNHGAAQIASKVTSVELEERVFDFGTIEEGASVTHIYKVKNTGKEPLIISNAQGSCGCTVPEWSKDPIAPGKSAEIKVVFNSAGKRGQQEKSVTLTANTDPVQTVFFIKGMVEAKK